MQVRKFFCLLAFFAFTVLTAHAQTAISATTIPTDRLVQPEELVKLLQSTSAQPLILQVGSRVMFGEAHIRGSQYAGPASTPAGLKALESSLTASPKDHLIVLYCGCCPWGRCPNVGPAFKHLQELGYKNVKVLYLPNNFGDDWVSKGYPTEHK